MYELLTISVGAAVSKAVFKVWFKDSDFTSAVSQNLVDVIAATIKDSRAKSAAQRQFSRVSESVAEALEPLINAEWPGIEENELSSVMWEVNHSIEKIRINAKFLVGINNSPEKLARNIYSNGDTSHFSTDSKHLFQRVSNECAQLIVDLSGNLPGFSPINFGEILKREQVIIEKIDEIFIEFSKIKAQSSAVNAEAASRLFEENYRRATARSLDEIELFGLDTDSNSSSRRHNLTTAYISLSVSSYRETPNPTSKDGSTSTVSITQKSKNYSLNSSIRVERAINLSPRVIVRGEAGSGKTTLLQYIAVQCATARFQGEMSFWNELVPFFIRLRALSENYLPRPEHLPEQVAPLICATMPSTWVHDQMRKGRAVILIDGLDEISEERRDKVREWLKEMVGHFPDCRYVVTSRPSAISFDWLSKEGFAEVSLLPMGPGDVDEFIDHWHDAVFKAEIDISRRSEIDKLAPDLKERIRSDRSLRELATSPLLCAMLCAMHRDKKRVLPSNRNSLYDSAIAMIIHGRDKQRKVNMGDIPDLDLEVKVKILQEIAFWMMENNLSMADSWRVEERVASLLPHFPKLPDHFTAKDVLKSLTLRSGVLRTPIEGKVDFIHNAFKEFLCARAVASGDRFGYLAKQVEYDNWRDIGVLAPALADETRKNDFIEGLLKAGESSQRKRSIYYLIAVGCLETCVDLKPDLQKKIREKIAVLRPPVNISEAKSLSAAGDLSLPLLSPTRAQNVRGAAACIRALRLVNTAAALDLLEKYGADPRSTVLQELIAAWAFFDRTEYARRVLSQTEGVRGRLEIEIFPKLEGLRYLQKIRSLMLRSHRQSIDSGAFREIMHLTNLLNLTVICREKFNYSVIKTLNNLTNLYIDAGALEADEPIPRLYNLRNLSLSADNGSIDIDGIQNLQELRAVHLKSNERLINIDKIGNLSKLKSLDIYLPGNNLQVYDLSFFRNISDLRELRIGQIGFKQFDVISKMDKVTEFFAHFGDDVTSLDQIRMPKLTQLFIQHAHKLQSLHFLSKTPLVTRLMIGNCLELQSISPVADMEKVEELYITRCPKLKDLHILNDLKSLKILWITRDMTEIIGKMSPHFKVRFGLPLHRLFSNGYAFDYYRNVRDWPR